MLSDEVFAAHTGSDQLLISDRLQYPPISDLAQPMLRLAGLRINPANNGRHHAPRLVSLSLVEVATGTTRKITGLPANAYLGAPVWSPDGKQFAFTNTTADGIELWLGSAVSASAARMEGVKVSSIMGEAIQWMPDSHTLLVQTIPSNRSKLPEEPKSPEGPIIQESDPWHGRRQLRHVSHPERAHVPSHQRQRWHCPLRAAAL